MDYDADFDLNYDDYDSEADWEETQRIIDEQDALDRKEEERLYGSEKELRFIQRFDDPVYLQPDVRPLDPDLDEE